MLHRGIPPPAAAKEKVNRERRDEEDNISQEL